MFGSYFELVYIMVSLFPLKLKKKFLDISLNCDDGVGHKRHKHAGGLPHICTLFYLIRV